MSKHIPTIRSSARFILAALLFSLVPACKEGLSEAKACEMVADVFSKASKTVVPVPNALRQGSGTAPEASAAAAAAAAAAAMSIRVTKCSNFKSDADRGVASITAHASTGWRIGEFHFRKYDQGWKLDETHR
jgi:hypothetical protein